MDKNKISFADLLHINECPMGFDCLTTDCIECMKLHMEKGEAADGKMETESN